MEFNDGNFNYSTDEEEVMDQSMLDKYAEMSSDELERIGVLGGMDAYEEDQITPESSTSEEDIYTGKSKKKSGKVQVKKRSKSQSTSSSSEPDPHDIHNLLDRANRAKRYRS